MTAITLQPGSRFVAQAQTLLNKDSLLAAAEKTRKVSCALFFTAAIVLTAAAFVAVITIPVPVLGALIGVVCLIAAGIFLWNGIKNYDRDPKKDIETLMQQTIQQVLDKPIRSDTADLFNNLSINETTLDFAHIRHSLILPNNLRHYLSALHPVLTLTPIQQANLDAVSNDDSPISRSMLALIDQKFTSTHFSLDNGCRAFNWFCEIVLHHNRLGWETREQDVIAIVKAFKMATTVDLFSLVSNAILQVLPQTTRRLFFSLKTHVVNDLDFRHLQHLSLKRLIIFGSHRLTAQQQADLAHLQQTGVEIDQYM